ncbi:MAG: iron-sulfur cluster assembly accessory protein [Rhabdochlamydiaceae bacterium]|nr:iron-sulfur cluster assembly accessory protein [Rhabdochlamydiaceae bacterium]
MSEATNAMKITREMTIEEILSSFPQKSQKIAQEMTNAGLHCVGCGAATWETLEAGMLSHGFPEEEIDALVARLNNILSEKADLTTISLTKRAAEKYSGILADEGKSGWGLRFGDKAAGCSGFEYVLDYSEKATPDDAVFTSHGVEIHVSKKMVDRLLGSEIDYVDGLNGSGFKISNPNAKGSCGCGKSQSY